MSSVSSNKRRKTRKEIELSFEKNVQINDVWKVEAAIEEYHNPSDPDSPLFHRNEAGESLVALASARNHPIMVELLLKWKVDPNWDERLELQGKNGNNALHLAVGKPEGPARVALKGSGLKRLIDALLTGGCNPWALNAKGWSPYALASCSEDMLIPLRMMESRSLLKGTLKLGIVAKKLFKTSTAMKEMHCVLAPSMTPGVQVAPLTLYFFQSVIEVSIALIVSLDGVAVEPAVGGSPRNLTLKLAGAKCIQGKRSDCLPSPTQVELGAEGEEGLHLLKSLGNILRSCKGNISTSLAKHLLLGERKLETAEIEERIVRGIHQSSQRLPEVHVLDSGPHPSSPRLPMPATPPKTADLSQAATPPSDAWAKSAASTFAGAHHSYAPSISGPSCSPASGELRPAPSAPPYIPEDHLHHALPALQGGTSEAGFSTASSSCSLASLPAHHPLAGPQATGVSLETTHPREARGAELNQHPSGSSMPSHASVDARSEAGSGVTSINGLGNAKSSKRLEDFWRAKEEKKNREAAEEAARLERKRQEEEEEARVYAALVEADRLEEEARLEEERRREEEERKRLEREEEERKLREREEAIRREEERKQREREEQEKREREERERREREERERLRVAVEAHRTKLQEEVEHAKKLEKDRLLRIQVRDEKQAALRAKMASKKDEHAERLAAERAAVRERERVEAEMVGVLEEMEAEEQADKEAAAEEARQSAVGLQRQKEARAQLDALLKQVGGGAAPAEDDDDDPHMLCPITHDVMTDPVILVGDGHTYERAAIENWLAQKSTSPITGVALSAGNKGLVTNYSVKSSIEAWVTRKQKH